MSEKRGWKTKSVKDLCHLGRGRVISGEEVERHPGEYPVFSSQSKDNGRMGAIDTFDFEGEYVTWTTDGAYAGTVFYRTGRFNCTNVCGTLAAKDPELSLGFLAYKLATCAKDHVSYVGNPKLMNGVMANIEISLPESKPEQTKIAEILSTVDRAIEQTEALIAKQQRLKTGLMQDLLTRGIDEHGNLRSEETHEFKDSPLGRIPVEWEVKQIKDFGLVVTGNTPSESAFDDYYQSVPFVTPADVGVTTAIQRTTRSFGKASATSVRMIPAGSICVVCIGSTIGKIGFTVFEAATNQQINSVIPHEPKVSDFLLYSMLLNLPLQLRKEAGLQAVPIVNKSTFERLLIAKPVDFKETVEIQRQISSPASTAESATRALHKLRALKTALMQDLLTGRKRVTDLLDEKEASA